MTDVADGIRRRRASAWVGLYVGLFGVDSDTDEDDGVAADGE